MDYFPRLVDKELDNRIKAFNAINIVGPKGCGKTRTAKERCKTVIEFQDEERREGYLNIAQTAPSLFLKNEKPILFDEWQDAPKIWGTIRKDCDDNPQATGQYFLTGSSSKKINTPHTGTGRISEVTMFPMTLFETKESSGTISLSKLFEDKNLNIDGNKNNVALEDLFYIVCRGGWPRCLAIEGKDAKLQIAADYYEQIYKKDISAIDGVKRNPEWARTILWSYARNMATLAKKSVLFADASASNNISEVTFSSYIEALENLFVIKDIDAWTPMHYCDDIGLESDAVYQLADGRYALIEIKTGENSIPSAEKNLLKFGELIEKHNTATLADKEHPGVLYRKPDLLIVICATASMAYTTSSGVKVIPFGCLRD